MMSNTVLDLFRKAFPKVNWDRPCYDYRLVSPASVDDPTIMSLMIKFGRSRNRWEHYVIQLDVRFN